MNCFVFGKSDTNTYLYKDQHLLKPNDVSS